MKKSLCFVCCSLLSASLWAQEPLASDLSKEVDRVAALIKSNPAGASDGFKELLKGKNKKNVALIVAIGQEYLKADKLEEAKNYAEKARDVNSKTAAAHILIGDIALKKGDAGTACGAYEQAMLFDPNNKQAYYKYAEAYEGVNPQLSVQKLEEWKAKHPEDIDVDRELANVYYQMKDYSKAKSAYDTFMQQGGKPTVQDYGRYSTLLYLTKDYQQSLDMAQKGLAEDANNHLLKRCRMYDLYELKSYDEGLKAAESFFSNPNSPDYVYLDYLYHARLFAAVKDYEKAVAEYDKAYKLDNTHAEIVKEVADVYEQMQKYPEAIKSYKSYLDAIKDKAEISDLFLFGRLYYSAASADTASTERAAYLTSADSIFAQVAERVPDNYLGSFWRARVNALRDPETTEGLAKPYYEAALAILEKDPNSATSRKAILIECQSYLGYYYFLKKEYEQSKEYWNKILAIDPENATAKQALEGIH